VVIWVAAADGQQTEAGDGRTGGWLPHPTRTVAIVGLTALLLTPPIRHLSFAHTSILSAALTVADITVLLAIFLHLGIGRRFETQRTPLFWSELAAFYVLAVTIVVRDGATWIPALALVAAICGLRCDRRTASVLAVACATTAFVFVQIDHEPISQGAIIILLTLVMAMFSYGSGQRVQAIYQLQENRRHLARIAVQEERLRFARDLHDLLGHSLSVIIVKAELAERILRANPEFAERELSEVQGVARRSLSEVRQAVTGYRQSSLSAEVAASRFALASAQISCDVDLPPDLDLPADAEDALAWAVREGVTNVVRHSGATACAIRVTQDGHHAEVNIDDNGTTIGDGRGGDAVAVKLGAGLAGLSERAATQGGEVRLSRDSCLNEGPNGTPASGLRLTMTIPLDGTPRNREAT
jgi:two-component system sensor histidine kinase DesK